MHVKIKENLKNRGHGQKIDSAHFLLVVCTLGKLQTHC